MPKSQFVDFKTIKSTVSIAQVLEHYGLFNAMKRSGDSLSGCCPLHGGTNPTQFRVSLSKNVWNCFSDCKSGGNVLDFVSRKEQISIHAAATKLTEWFNIPTGGKRKDTPKDSSDSPISKTIEAVAKTTRTKSSIEEQGANPPLKFRLEHLDHGHAYLAERGLSQATAIDFGLGYCAKGMMAGRIAIPIHNTSGEVVAYAGRWPGDPPEGTPKYKLPPGFKKSLELFNIDKARGQTSEHPLVIVEGFFGAMNLWQLGFKRVVALMGSSMSEAQESLIRKHTNAQSRVLVILDEDEAGRAGREDIARRLARFCFVKVHAAKTPGFQPEQLTAEEVMGLFE